MNVWVPDPSQALYTRWNERILIREGEFELMATLLPNSLSGLDGKEDGIVDHW